MDAVVHLAAIVGDPACARSPELAREVNREASLALVEAAHRSGVERFVFASTCSNYGRMDSSLEYVAEDAVLQPLSLYAETKVAVEEAILARGDPAFTVLRFATVYGLSQRMRLDLTVNQFAVELFAKRRLVVFGEQFWRPYVHTWDAAAAIASVLSADSAIVGGDVFNVGATDENYRKADLVEFVRQQLEGSVEIERIEVAEDPRDYRVSFEKIRERMGFAPKFTVPDGIREVIHATATGVLADLDDPAYRN
jgi:nucleoside-diphosphate-sugar epimerase